MAFGSGIVPENYRSDVNVPLNTVKRERIKCKNNRGISMLTVVRKIYEGQNH